MWLDTEVRSVRKVQLTLEEAGVNIGDFVTALVMVWQPNQLDQHEFSNHPLHPEPDCVTAVRLHALFKFMCLRVRCQKIR